MSSANAAYGSWGRYPVARQQVLTLAHRQAALPDEASLLPYGNGRSYGDSCLNDGGTLLHTRTLDRFIAFDPASGVLRCEAGVLLAEILERVVPQGWFLPVTPGTRYVTVGGALANDVHGKNHHRAGTFGCHVRSFELLRSDGTRRLCTPTTQPDWFAATIGGLGLTGLIVWAELQLRPITNPYLHQETVRFPDLATFFALSAASDRDFEYTVAWLDCLASGRSLGRGLFMRANHAAALCPEHPQPPQRFWRVPLTPPVSLINPLSLRAFNTLYYHRPRRRLSTVHYLPFFYPLDSLLEWNRIYGPRGFLQYQCVVPLQHGQDAIAEILAHIAAAGSGSFLAVLKLFGQPRSPGLLSFPRPGVTLALDFPNRGAKTFALLDRLDNVVVQAGGAVYPAKDARMSGASFRHYYPQWTAFQEFIDPRFSSSFWRRVMESA